MPKLMQYFRKQFSHIQCSFSATLKAVAATHLRETVCTFWTNAISHFVPIVRIGSSSIPATCRSIPLLTG